MELAIQVFSIVVFLVFLRMVVIVFHEAGHALAMAYFTKGNVIVFLGSYGNKEKSRKFALGKFDVWVVKNILKWKGGLCIPNNKGTFRGQIIYTLAGPFGSLLFGVIALLCFVAYRPQGMAAGMLVVCCIAGAMSFLYNIVPHQLAIVTNNGNLTYNDGAQIRAMIDRKKQPAEFNEAIALYNKQEYATAVAILVTIISNGTKIADVYRLAISANIQLKDYDRADELQKQQTAKIGNLNTNDRINMALLKMHLGKYEEAIAYHKHLLQLYGENKYVLNNLGYTLTVIDRYIEAIPYLDKAILIDSDFAYAWCNRGYAKIRLGAIEDGRRDNERGLQLDDTNAHAYRNSGIYYFDRQNYEAALAQFEKANSLDPETPLLRKYIFETNERIAKTEK